MENKTDVVSKSYDRTIELSQKGIHQYKQLPDYITSNPMYLKYQRMQLDDESGSGNHKVKGFLEPCQGMKFIDMGCCLNLVDRNYKSWKSLYYGVDISKNIILTLEEYIEKQGIVVGGLYLGNMRETPYKNEFFDIGTCIGSLEYYEEEFVKATIKEFDRILKPDAHFVLDIPNFDSDECKISMMIEEYLGRKDEFNMSVKEFEKLLICYFDIINKVYTDTITYFLKKK